MDLTAIVRAEVAAINDVFRGRNVDAGTRAGWTVEAGSSFIAYGVHIGPRVLPQDIGKLLPKLSEAISAVRRKPTPVRLRTMPLALEVEHPYPAPLPWQRARCLHRPGVMLTGRNYSASEPCDDVLNLDESPHVLIAGTTGSGKSTLLRMMLATLALNTDPDDLRLYLVDLKNEDLLPLMRLPHVAATAVKFADACELVRTVHGIKEDRVDEGRTTGPRIVLVIDELAQLADRETLELLGSVMSIGRSKRINVIAATQKPTVDVVGKLSKSNVTTRFVGRVTTTDEATVAAGRGGTGAQLLPGRGAFLRVEGADVTRLQAYWLDDAGTVEMVKAVHQRWGAQPQVVTEVVTGPVTEPVLTGSNQGITGSGAVSGAEMVVEPVTGSAVTVRFPLPASRPPTPAEALALRQLYAASSSKNETLRVAYGGKNGTLLAYLNQALEGGAQ